LVTEILTPVIPIKHGTYLCDKKFFTDNLQRFFFLPNDYGVVLIEGEKTEFKRITGTLDVIVGKITIDRQKRQKKGGQSAHRFQFIRIEQINQYIKRICEDLRKYFISDNGLPSVEGLFLIGSADVKLQVSKSIDFPAVLKSRTNHSLNNQLQRIEYEKLLVNNRHESKIMTEIKEYLSRGNLGKISYGKDDLYRNAREGLLSDLVLCEEHKEQDLIDIVKDKGCRIHVLNDQVLSQYGGMLGKKWFESDTEIL